MHDLIGYGDWYWDSGIIAEGSASQAIEGRHYYRSMRIHKEGFDALSQYRIEEITSCYKDIEPNFMNKLKQLRRKPSNLLVTEILNSKEFENIFETFISVSGNRAKMTCFFCS